jgi:hypothetical protein
MEFSPALHAKLVVGAIINQHPMEKNPLTHFLLRGRNSLYHKGSIPCLLQGIDAIVSMTLVNALWAASSFS